MEDQPADYDLAKREIRRIIKKCRFKRVEKQKNFLKALQDFQADLIVSEYQLPDFGGMEVLELTQNYSSSIPVIIWTRTPDEDAVVNSIKQGASNFVLKENSQRLGTAVLHALEERQAVTERRTPEQEFRTITEDMTELICRFKPDGVLTYVNQVYCDYYGKTSEELLGTSFIPIAEADYPQKLTEHFKSLTPEDPVKRFEQYDLRPNGEKRRREWVDRGIFAKNGNIIEIQSTGRDITERKATEEKLRGSEEKYRLLFQSNPLPMWIYDLESLGFLKVNDAAVRHYGYSVEEFMSMTIEDIRPKEDASKLREKVANFTEGIVEAGVWRHLKKDGTVIQVEIISHQVEFAGRKSKLVLAIDVTERMLTEKKLRESENSLILALSGAQISVWEWNLRTNDILWSPEFYSITDITDSGFDGAIEGYAELIHPQDAARIRESVEMAVATNTMFTDEFRIIRPDGDVRWLSNVGHAEYGQSGNSLRMIGTVQDITLRKQVEIERQALLEIMQALARTEDLQEVLRLIHHSIGNVIYARNFFVVFYNQDTGLFEEIYSVDQYDPPAPPSRLEKSVTSYVFHKGEPLLLNQARFDELVEQGEVELIGTHSASWLGAPIKTPNETIGVIVVQDYENPNCYSERDKNFLASIATQVAIALERKEAEEKLRKGEERYRALFENSPVSIWEEDFSLVKRYLDSLKQQGISDFRTYFASHPEDVTECTGMIRVLDVNNAGLQMYRAKSKKELIESTLQSLCIGEREHNHEDFIAVAEGKTSNGWEGADETITGEPLEINLRWSVAPGHEKDYSKVIVTVIDITERKRAEMEISRRAEETAALLATSLALTNLDLKEILQSIGTSAKTLFAADGCRIFHMQPDGESLRCVLALQENFSAFSDLRIKLGDGVTGAVAASGQAEIVNEMQKDLRAMQVPGTIEEEEAIMFAPLKERDRTIGVLSVRRAGKDRPFHGDDLEFLEAFASMAASAVSNARLFEETQRRLAELEALYENGLAVGQLLEPRQIGERIIETFARHLSWQHVSIRLVRPGTDELQLIAFNQPGLSGENRADIEKHFNALVHKVGQGLSGWAIHTGKPIRASNVHEYPEYANTYEGIRSGLYMPLCVGERVIGVISVESEDSDALTAQDEKLLATLANQAAVAFENARLYQSAQEEIAERKRVERELRESQERYQLLVETSPDGVIMMNMDGVIRFSNMQMADLFNIDNPADLIGANIVSLFAPEERGHIRQLIGTLTFSDAPQEGHWLMRKDRSRFFGELRSSALRNEKGDQYAMIAQLRDVTERRLSQETIREERQKFLDLFENSPNPIWLEDFTAVIAWMDELRTLGVTNLRKYFEDNPEEYKVGLSLIRILNVNNAAVIMNGARNKQEVLGRVHELLLNELPSHVMIHEMDMIWQGNTSFGFEMSRSRMDGSFVTGILRIHIPINNDRPDYARVMVTSTDITERKLSETLLQKRFELVEYSARHAFEEVLQKTIDVVSELTGSHIGFMHFIGDDQTTIHLQAWSTETLRHFSNPEEGRMHYPVEQAGVWADAVRQRRSLIHNDYASLPDKKGMPPGHAKLVRQMVIPVIRNERIVAVVGVGNKLQEYIRQDIETAERFVDYAWDITERKQMESVLAEERNQLAKRVEERTADLSRANSNLARALRVKDEFLANMSHELRTPLNAILGLSESLGEQVAGPLNEKQQKYLATINESGHHLLSLINDILDLAKIEAGQITLDINMVDVNSVCQASLRMIKQLAHKKNQEVSFEMDDDLGLMWADERRLKQMIVNLLSNAVKFTPESGRIGLEVRGDRAANKVIITVWDTGIGIQEQDLDRLFKPFIQLDSGLAREATGT
ncbi:MAG TPA: GAF domain-containing protein, partial [Anaerolineales bacterium]|nr:GAF domain-containing protein [Anaerolineales bacterium]